MKDPLLLLLIAGVSGVYCSHSLQYYYTAVSVPGYGLPEFSVVGYVDGIQIDNYSSDTGRDVPVAQWLEKEDPDYKERNTQIFKGAEAVFKHNVRTAMQRFNQTGGYHSVQNMYGCELRDDGSIGGYNQHGYDGKDFLALDTERWVYYPLSAQAQLTTQRWNSPEVRQGERNKNYLENLCIESLRKYIQYGKEELDRRVPPEVKVSDQKADGTTKLLCQAYGFYPRDVDVIWKKDGIEVPSDEAKKVLPNTDGTYQITATVEVPPEEMDRHSCHVEHISLDKTLIVKWEPKSNLIMWIVIGVVSLAVIGIAVAGFVMWKKRSGKEYVAANVSENGGSSSSDENLKA
ncbi:H-2 class I histocompatibility antigen, Q9 alpha chain-like [Pelobates fuscus]|uniref:H-2 class I histocompatibility antigen, Q9 alpha chain-like n=1 Tax=Pelobates fuscus TaxID=191477 RepID=UPI002FE4F81C